MSNSGIVIKYIAYEVAKVGSSTQSSGTGDIISFDSQGQENSSQPSKERGVAYCGSLSVSELF
jgi:hypothetical protein